MFTCFVRYKLDLEQLRAFEEYARIWTELIQRSGGTHHGYFVACGDGDQVPVSFPGLGKDGPADEAVASFSFPDRASYEHYRREAGKSEGALRANKILEETKCFTSYERNFMLPIGTT